MQNVNPLVMTLTESSNNAMSQMAQEGAKSGFFSGLYETAKATVANNPIAVAAGITAIGVAGICWYGYRNWGWFGGQDALVAEPAEINPEDLQKMVDAAIAQAMVNAGIKVPAPAQTATAEPAAAAPVAQAHA